MVEDQGYFCLQPSCEEEEGDVNLLKPMPPFPPPPALSSSSPPDIAPLPPPPQLPLCEMGGGGGGDGFLGDGDPDGGGSLMGMKPSFVEAETRMNEDMIRMIEVDDLAEEARQELLSMLPDFPVGGVKTGRQRGYGLREGEDEEEEEEDGELELFETENDPGRQWLRSLIVRLMMHSASSGRPFSPSLASDLQCFVGSELYQQIVSHAGGGGLRRDYKSFGSSSDFNWDFRSLSEPNSRRSKGLDPFETRFNLSRGENHEEDSSRRLVFGEEDGDDEEGGLVPRMIKKSLAGLQIKQSERDQTGKWQPDPVMASSSSFSGGMDCGDDDKVAITSSTGDSGKSSRDGDGNLVPLPEGDVVSDDRAKEKGLPEEEDQDVDVDDEWENDADPGYVAYPITEAEFYELEKEAMEAAHRASLAAEFGKDFIGVDDDEEGGTSGSKSQDAGMKEAEALLKKAPVPDGPTSPKVEVPPEVGGGGSWVAAAEAAVWPRHADDFAFSQSGDDEEYQSYIHGVDASTSEKDTSVGPLDQCGTGPHRVPWGLSQGCKQAPPSQGSGDHSEVCARILELSLSGQFGAPCASTSIDRRNSADTSDVSDPDVASSTEDEDEGDKGHRHRCGPEDLECFHMKVIFERHRTGFEETKDYTPPVNTIIAGRYQVQDYLGTAVFSTAIQCLDLETVTEDNPEGVSVCLKIIKNNKDFFDQSLDEIKLLQYLKDHGDPDRYHFLCMYDYFYYKEHLFIVSELLKDNLYEFGRYIKETGSEPYFTLERLQSIMRQCLEALAFIHKRKLIHCDIKPENIVIRSYSRCEIKIIDFGSSCFDTDHLTSYIQSRSYRAPEVTLGVPYSFKIDVWSLGCVLAELFTGYVLFQNDSIQSMLARMMGILGPFPDNLLLYGRDVNKYFTANHFLFERTSDESGDAGGGFLILHPKRTTLAHRLHTNDPDFVDFVTQLLQLDPLKRPTAHQALQHPWITTNETNQSQHGEVEGREKEEDAAGDVTGDET